MPMVVEPQSLDSLSPEQLRSALLSMLQAAAAKDQELAFKQTLIDKLTHENALLKRMKFAAQSERFSPEQKSLLDDEIEADLAAVASEIDALAQTQAPATPEKRQAKRMPLPAHLPRREIRHEPTSTTCACGCQMKRVGEDVAEKLDYVPGVFSVERHIRSKWACARCETIQQAPVEAHVIDKGIPTTGLLAQVLVHDGIGVWLAARRLNSGKFVWPREGALTATLNRSQFDALVLGLPWQRLGDGGVITVL